MEVTPGPQGPWLQGTGAGGCYPFDLGLLFCVAFKRAGEGREEYSGQGNSTSKGRIENLQLMCQRERAAEFGVRGPWVGEGGAPQGQRGSPGVLIS